MSPSFNLPVTIWSKYGANRCRIAVSVKGDTGTSTMTASERQLEAKFVENLLGLKYENRPDIRDRATMEKNFREKFEALNRVRLTDAEFQRLLDEIITPDVFAAARTLRGINSF